MAGVLVGVGTGRRFAWTMAVVTAVPFLAAPLAAALGLGTLPVLAVVLGAPHVGTTAAFYFDPELRPTMAANPTRYYLAPLAALAVAGVVALSAPEQVTAYLVAGFLAWQLHHFTRQNLGCFAFVARATGQPGPTAEERRLLDLTTVAAVLTLPRAAGLALAGPLFVAGAVVLAIAMVHAWSLARSADPLRGAMIGAVAVFYLPLFLFPVGSAALLGYALAHGAQYLLMMGHLPAGRIDRRPMLAALVAGFVVVGLTMQVAMDHWLGSPAVFALFYAATATHFIVDAGVWKMRTPEQRAYMRARFAFL